MNKIFIYNVNGIKMIVCCLTIQDAQKSFREQLTRHYCHVCHARLIDIKEHDIADTKVVVL